MNMIAIAIAIIFIGVSAMVVLGYYIHRIFTSSMTQDTETYELWVTTCTLLSFTFIMYGIQLMNVLPAENAYFKMMLHAMHITCTFNMVKLGIHTRVFLEDARASREGRLKSKLTILRIKKFFMPIIDAAVFILIAVSFLLAKDKFDTSTIPDEAEVLSTGFRVADNYYAVIEPIVGTLIFILTPGVLPYRFFKIAILLYTIGLYMESNQILFNNYQDPWPYTLSWLLTIGTMISTVAGLVEHIMWKRKYGRPS